MVQRSVSPEAGNFRFNFTVNNLVLLREEMKTRECNNEKTKKSTENRALAFILSHNVRTNAAEDRKDFSCGHPVEFTGCLAGT